MSTIRLSAGVCVALLSVLIGGGRAYAQAPGEPSAVIANDCNYTCLIGFVRDYMQALAARTPAKAHLAPNVRFTENNVELVAGKEGLWATISAVPAPGLEVADTTTGEAAWIGAVEENELPVYYGMRLKVREQAVVEVESVVVRTTGLPLPFGDVKKLVHDPAFAEVLPESERRPRERLVAVANSYFSTVELNDGMVFAPFDEDCARLENGILTTKGGTGSSGDIAQGCEQQFKLGIYRINKRVRERRYPIVDVERGVVVATGFFDHANEFDRYKTTDGVERKTLLKWPNSISLVEAFKIRAGRIYRIEAVFTYVPYFMHSPFYAYPSSAENEKLPAAPANPSSCAESCLTRLADRYMDALMKRDPSTLPWAKRVRYTENGVSMMIGEGIWGSARSKASPALRVADPQMGNVIWYGVVFEHDAPAYYAMRLHVTDQRIADVEAWVARARNPGPFGDAAHFKLDASLEARLSSAERQPRERLQALAESHANTVGLGNGTLALPFARNFTRIANGADVTSEPVSPSTLDRLRAHRILAIDMERGLVISASLADYSLADIDYRQSPPSVRYPSSREFLEILKLRRGEVQRAEIVSVFQPYGMRSAWP